MMNAELVSQIISRAVGSVPDPARLQEMLATTLRQTGENPYWTFYEFELKNGPLAGGEFRQSKEAGRALLSLRAREESELKESDLDLDRWGEVVNIDVNPRIQPEGADAYSYSVEGVQVSFQFTHTSRRLRSIALEWGTQG